MPADDSLPRRSTRISVPVQGAIFMTVAALFFALMNALIREAAQELHVLEVAFFRNFFALLFMLPWLARAGISALRTERLGLHIWRAVIGLSAMSCWFASVTFLPMAEAVALNFTLPLFATAGAAFFLAEKVGPRRWGATFVGFLGMLVILRPGFVEMSPMAALPVVAAAFMAVSVLIVKSLSGTENPNAVVLYMNLFMTPMSLVPALFVWRWPGLETLLYLVGIGLLATVAHLFLMRAYVRADASAIMPFDYMRLPFVAVLAFLLYGEVPDGWTWTGAAIIAASAFYIARREALQARLPSAGEAPKGRL